MNSTKLQLGGADDVFFYEKLKQNLRESDKFSGLNSRFCENVSVSCTSLLQA